jgi:hypothetical protein
MEWIKCQICGKKLATKQCDMPIRRGKHLHLKKENGLTDYENSFKEYTTTCDRYICDKCAVSVGDGIDFCLDCFKRIKNM